MSPSRTARWKWLARRRIARALPQRAKPPLRTALAAVDPARLWFFRRRTGHAGPIPPRPLRADVGDPDPSRFVANGERLVDELVGAARAGGVDLVAAESVLDFACGCGRVLVPLRRRREGRGSLVGSDVHAPAIEWLQRELGPGGSAVRNGWGPPLPFDDGEFDVVYSYSLFTHLDRPTQAAWLEDLCRVLKPGGVALLTTHGPSAFERFRGGGVSGTGSALLGRLRAYRPLDEEGFVFEAYEPGENATAGIGGPYGLAFNARSQIEDEWARWLQPVQHLPRGAQDWQDITVLRKPTA